MSLHKISYRTLHRWARPLTLGALLLTSSALCLTGCGGSKPEADTAQTGPQTGSAAPAAAPASSANPAGTSAKDEAIMKEAAQEKNPEGGGK